MSHIVFGITVIATKIVRILRNHRRRRISAKGEKSTVRDFIQSMAVGVVSLEHPIAPARELVLEGNDQTVVVRHSVRAPLGNLTESRIGAGWNGWAGAWSRGKRSETKCVGI